jgi:thiamine-phosphate pyrophosphorylase
MTPQERLAEARLYAIVDLGYVPESGLRKVCKELVKGGADLVQLRAKGRPVEQILGFARQLHPICQEAGVPLIINDHPSIAAEVGAEGVHVGQDDGDLAAVREEVGESVIVGRSTHSHAQALAALREGADYIGFGPLFPTPTKQGRPGIGLGSIATAEQEVGRAIPMFCIGGIKTANLPEVLAAGARRVVIVSGLLQADEVADEVARVQGVLRGTA